VRDPWLDDPAWEIEPRDPRLPRRVERYDLRRKAAPVTSRLIMANVTAFVVQAGSGDAMLARFALWPLGRFRVPELGVVVGFHPWQLLTYAFLHANLMHLFLNMLGLRIFGGDVESALGGRRYLTLYVAAVLSAAVVQLLVVSAGSGVPYPTIGASGGVFGVLLAFGVLYPRRIVTLLFPPIPMPAWLFVALYGTLELVSGVLGTEAGVAHLAHVGGMMGAYVLLRRWRRQATYETW
jgi:membrane associated rhomboid family serine protease